MAETVLGTAVVPIRAKLDQLDKDLSEAKGKVDKASDGLDDRLGKIGSKMQGIGAGMTIGLTAPLLLAGKASIDAASDMNESASKSQVVFGNWNGTIETFAQGAAKNLGMSRQAATEAAGTFGNLFTAMGIGQGPAADMSTSILQLAADLASFNNQDPKEVLDKLRAGLVGETEPLRSLGVNLNAAAVEARAMEMGLVDANGEVTTAGKAQASYALILEQTKTAQGDFARTSEGVANQQRISNAQMADAAAVMGQQLLPIQLKVTGAVSSLATAFSGLSPELQTVVLAIGGVLLAAGPVVGIIGTLVSVIGFLTSASTLNAIATTASSVATGIWTGAQWLLNAALTANPIGLIVAGLALLVGGLIYAYNNSETFRAAIDNIAATIMGVVQPAIQGLSDFFNTTLLPALQSVAEFITGTIWPILEALASVYIAVVSLAITALAGLWQNVLYPALESVVGFITGTVWPILQRLVDLYLTPWRLAFELISNVVQTVLLPALESISGFISGTLEGVLGSLKKSYIDPLAASFDGVTSAIKKATGWLSDLASGIRAFKLPDWLTPGSPTPFEMGLWGISDALKSVSREASLDFGQIAAPPMLARSGSSGSASYVESLAARGGSGANNSRSIGPIVIQVSGAGDPNTVAQRVYQILLGDRDAVMSGGVA
jgi:hypothetical protein